MWNRIEIHFWENSNFGFIHSIVHITTVQLKFLDFWAYFSFMKLDFWVPFWSVEGTFHHFDIGVTPIMIFTKSKILKINDLDFILWFIERRYIFNSPGAITKGKDSVTQFQYKLHFRKALIITFRVIYHLYGFEEV